MAPRLQAGLQRFAKPWWKRRALRIFRDESSLSANPHLWSSITVALDGSAWMVVLLSPDSAASQWVNDEIAYWVEHKDTSRVIPVVTDGKFGWEGGSLTGDAAPAALQSAFTDEPRWVDLRWARSDTQLDLSNARFRDAIADVASAIRGIPKDELESEEVRQHRRTRRTAWGAGVGLFLLGVAATIGAIVAVNQSSEARTQRDQAQQLAESEAEARADADEQRREADRLAAAEADQRTQAEANARLAEEQTSIALDQSALAEARELSASSIGVVDRDPELALLLALESMQRAPAGSGIFPEGLISLRQAVDANRLVDRMTLDTANDLFVDWTSDGSALIVSSDVIARYEVRDGKLVEPPAWVFGESSGVEGQWDIQLLTTQHTAVAFKLGFDTASFSLERVVLLDLETGEQISEVDLGPCLAPFQGGSRPALVSGGELLRIDLAGTECADDPGWFGSVLYDTSSWQEVHRFDRALASFTSDGTRVLVYAGEGNIELLSYPNLASIGSPQVEVDGEVVWPWLAPDGQTIVLRYQNWVDLRPGFWDVETDRLLAKGDGWDGFVVGVPLATADGNVLIPSTESDILYDPRTGLTLLELPNDATIDASISTDDRFVATSGQGGTVEIWAIGERAAGRELPAGPDGHLWINPDAIGEGAHTTLETFPGARWFGQWLLLVDPTTGATLTQRPTVYSAQLPTGEFVLVPSEPVEGGTIGPVSIWNPEDDTLTALQECAPSLAEYYPDDYRDPIGYVCEDGDLFFGGFLAVSADGRFIAQVGWDPDAAPLDRAQPRTDFTLRVWNAETLEAVTTLEFLFERSLGNGALGPFGEGWLLIADGQAGSSREVTYRIVDPDSGEEIAELDEEGVWRETREISSDYSRLYAVEESGRVWEYDTTSWDALRNWQAMEGRPRGMALNPDGTLLAVSGEDGLVAIWKIDVPDPVLVDRIPIGAWASDIMWIDDDRMAVAILHGVGRTEWRIVNLDPAAVADAARQSLVRDFTPDECRTYVIERCIEAAE